ncbi:hypothetical protein ACJ72_08213 [Emergomyces africanus]|uniref:Peptidase A1 domain-containing protein n=1 Tax=Emergomyces africanus TaxID=1955775 RepID=A0A1B7NL36_9EURO|nr:hypothetical protein ACJ72_08213 [Emergomyces africanus]
MLYICNVTLGTPPQQLRLHVDTGSSDLWVHSRNVSFLNPYIRPTSGYYDAHASSTANYLNSTFKIAYHDSTGASGIYMKDTLGIGGRLVPGFQFGVAYSSNSPDAVLGLGFPAIESQVLWFGRRPYPNLPYALVGAGLIRKPAYSMWLYDRGSAGSILFGGINKSKFHAPLVPLPLQPPRKKDAHLKVVITHVTLEKSGRRTRVRGNDTLPATAIVDTGSTFTYLPSAVVASLAENIGAVFRPALKSYVAPCRYKDANLTINVTLYSRLTISITARELFLGMSPKRPLAQRVMRNGEPACLFGFVPTTSGNVVLGDTFLRSVYAVYDLHSKQISMAAIKLSNEPDNIVEIQ